MSLGNPRWEGTTKYDNYEHALTRELDRALEAIGAGRRQLGDIDDLRDAGADIRFLAREGLMENITYSPASADDLPAVRALLAQCGLPIEDLKAGHLGHFVLCRSGGRVAGTVGLELLDDVALLRSLAVAPDLRGRRVGHELWNRALAGARRLGVKQLYLLTTTAEGLFVRWGFRRMPRENVPEVIRQTTEYSAVCPSTAAVMAMDLSAAPSAS